MKSWKDYQKLHQKKFRDEWQLFIVEGIRLCQEALDSDWGIEVAYTNENFYSSPKSKKFIKQIEKRSIKIKLLKETYFRKLSNTAQPQGILFVMKIPKHEKIRETVLLNQKFILILDGVRDPGNMGTIIRTADWFGVDGIIASNDSVDFFNPKVVRSSMGSIFRVSLLVENDMSNRIKILKAHHFQIITTSISSKKQLNGIRVIPPIALVLGSEVAGIAKIYQNLADENITIAGYRKTDSLNVAVAGGILMNQLAGILSNRY